MNQPYRFSFPKSKLFVETFAFINMSSLLLADTKSHSKRKFRESFSNQKIYWWVHLYKI